MLYPLTAVPKVLVCPKILHVRSPPAVAAPLVLTKSVLLGAWLACIEVFRLSSSVLGGGFVYHKPQLYTLAMDLQCGSHYVNICANKYCVGHVENAQCMDVPCQAV